MTNPLFLFAYLLLNTLGFAAQAQQTQSDSTTSSSRIIYSITDQRPAFPGGITEYEYYVKRNMRYPEAAHKAGITGKVFVAFVIDEQGAIRDVHALNSLNPALDAEAVRLIQNMPNWIPGKVNGKSVACRFNLPVRFSM